MVAERWRSSDSVDSFKLSDTEDFYDYIMMTCRYHIRGRYDERVSLINGTLAILPKSKTKRETIFYLPVIPALHLIAGSFKYIEIIPVPKDQHEAIIKKWKDGCDQTIINFYDRKNDRRQPYKKLILQLLTAYLIEHPVASELEKIVSAYTHGKFMGRRIETFQQNIEQGIEFHKLLVNQYEDASEKMEKICSLIPYLQNKEKSFEVRPFRGRDKVTYWKVMAIHEDGSERIVRTGFSRQDEAEAHMEHIKDIYARGIIKPPNNTNRA
jgi:hypothetical protein